MEGTISAAIRIDSIPVEERPPFESAVEATPDYFRTLGIPFTLGRPFSESESAAVVTDMFAKRYFGDKDPIGQGLQVGLRPDNPSYTIVGVIADYRLAGLNRETAPIVILNSCETCRSLLIITQRNR